MFKRQFDNDSDFSIKKYYRRQTIRKRKSKGRGINGETDTELTSGKWNLQETKFYVQFLKIHRIDIEDFKYRRQMKIFKQMSIYIKTRTPDQCRSHHQKVQKIHKEIDGIINFYQRKVMFGGNRKSKIQQNIVLVGSTDKEDKTTMLIETENWYQQQIVNQSLSITINIERMAQY